LQERLLEMLSNGEGLGMGDPFIRFLITDLGPMRAHIDGSHLSPAESKMLLHLKNVSVVSINLCFVLDCFVLFCFFFFLHVFFNLKTNLELLFLAQCGISIYGKRRIKII
jgi:hypothetical protein